MSHASLSKARASIESLRSTLAMARVLAEAGRPIDLAGLDREAATICAAVQRLPPEEGRSLRPLLVTLVNEVTILATTLPEPA